MFNIVFFRHPYDLVGDGFGGFFKSQLSTELPVSTRSVMEGLHFASQG